MTPEGIAYCSVAPSGKVLAVTDELRGLVYASSSSATPEKEIRFNPGEVPIGWTKDSRYLYFTDRKGNKILRYEFATGRREPWKDIPLAAPIVEIKHGLGLAITPDGQSYAYTYSIGHSDLYLVRGLR
jgi:hypothetical protein